MSYRHSRLASRVLRSLRVSAAGSPCDQKLNPRANRREVSALHFFVSRRQIFPIVQNLRANRREISALHFFVSSRQFLPIVQKSCKGTSMCLTAHQYSKDGASQLDKRSKESCPAKIKAAKVIYALGGPGSGKSTQCALIAEHFGYTHLSLGDLLRAEVKSGSPNGVMIQSMIEEGKIAPSEVSVNLLQKAMISSGNDKFLIDGFPRTDDNRSAFELVTGIRPEFILFFDSTEKEMEKRLLGRNQGRLDDNIEIIRKRFKGFVDSTLPVVRHYESFGKVRKINADRTKKEVFESLRRLFLQFESKCKN